ncbi:MAG: alpha/beta hydrolase [bacterium]
MPNNSKVIFMIHGMWGGPWYWEKYKTFFESNGYHCIVPTLLLHEKEANRKALIDVGKISLRDYVEHLEQQIRALQEPPIIMGHSMGGLLALILASKGLAKEAILITPAPPHDVFAFRWSVVRSFSSSFFRLNFWERPCKPTFGEAVYAMLHELSPDEQREVFEKFVYESGRAASEIGFSFFDAGKASWIEAKEIPCPVLVIGAEKDRITPASVVKEIAQHYGAAYKEFHGHAHWIIGEKGWKEVAEYLYLWMNGKTSFT